MTFQVSDPRMESSSSKEVQWSVLVPDAYPKRGRNIMTFPSPGVKLLGILTRRARTAATVRAEPAMTHAKAWTVPFLKFRCWDPELYMTTGSEEVIWLNEVLRLGPWSNKLVSLQKTLHCFFSQLWWEKALPSTRINQYSNSGLPRAQQMFSR